MNKLRLGSVLLAVAVIYGLACVWWWALKGMSADIALAHMLTDTIIGTLAFTIIMSEIG